jgi:ribosomal protein L11 methyltransferase
LDLGAGTGILALAAARLGVTRVTGVDYSHLAVAAALNNLRLNSLETQVEFHRAPAQLFHDRPGELLLANLHLSLQEELLDLGAFHGRRRVIVSGLLSREGERLWERLAPLGFKLADQIRTDRWVTLYGFKE